MERQPDFVREVAVITLGIFFGGLLLAGAARLYANIELSRAMDAINASNEQLNAEQQRRQTEVAQSRAEADARQRADLARKAQVTQAQADEVRRAGEAARAKEVAWNAYYQPSGKCADPAMTDATIECGNAHIRARREFESKWAAEHP